MAEKVENPGSFNDFLKGWTDTAVLTTKGDISRLQRLYFGEVTRFRHSLAAEKGISLDELHDGIGRTALRLVSEQAQIQATPTEAA